MRWRAKNSGEIVVVGAPLNKMGYHVGVLASDESLFSRVQAAVRSLEKAGTLEAIRHRWEDPDS